MKIRCPKCQKPTERKARIDSDDRVEAKWHYCPACGWDERIEAKERP